MCFKIDLVAAHVLKPHKSVEEERVKMLLVKMLLDNIIRTKVLRRPILVDCNTMTILDGHYRYEALRRLKVRKVLVIKVNYMDDSDIIVGT